MVELPEGKEQDMAVSILEINPGPDFKQTGDRLKLVIEELIEETCKITIDNYTKDSIISSNFKGGRQTDQTGQTGQFIQVYVKEWSVTKLRGGMSMK